MQLSLPVSAKSSGGLGGALKPSEESPALLLVRMNPIPWVLDFLLGKLLGSLALCSIIPLDLMTRGSPPGCLASEGAEGKRPSPNAAFPKFTNSRAQQHLGSSIQAAATAGCESSGKDPELPLRVQGEECGSSNAGRVSSAQLEGSECLWFP